MREKIKDTKFLKNTKEWPDFYASDKDLKIYIKEFKEVIYRKLSKRANSSHQANVLKKLVNDGYFCSSLSSEANDAILKIRSKALKKYKNSFNYLKDKLKTNLFRTFEINSVDKEMFELLNNEVKLLTSFLFDKFPSKLSLQLSSMNNPKRYNMKDLYEFHIDAIYPTFKIFIFLNSKDDRYLPYEFMPRSVFTQEELDEYYFFTMKAIKFFNKDNPDKFCLQIPKGIGQLTWNFSPSYLSKYQELTNKSCSIIQKSQNLLESISFTSQKPLLVVTDNSLFHRKSWQSRSYIREVLHYLPYERKPMVDWLKI